MRRLLSHFPNSAEIIQDGQPLGIQLRLTPYLRVVGPYRRPVAGVDVLNRDSRGRDSLFMMLEEWASYGSIVYEGMLIANEVKRTVELSRSFSTLIIALTTPVDQCLEAVQSRRLKRGTDPDLSDHTRGKLIEKHDELQRVYARLNKAGVVVELHNRDAAYNRLCGVLGLTPREYDDHQHSGNQRQRQKLGGPILFDEL